MYCSSGCVAYNTDLVCMCCDLLHNVCEVAVQHCPAVSTTPSYVGGLVHMCVYAYAFFLVYHGNLMRTLIDL